MCRREEASRRWRRWERRGGPCEPRLLGISGSISPCAVAPGRHSMASLPPPWPQRPLIDTLSDRGPAAPTLSLPRPGAPLAGRLCPGHHVFAKPLTPL
ncbi:unnamed protein product [Boreogadus saida]